MNADAYDGITSKKKKKNSGCIAERFLRVRSYLVSEGTLWKLYCLIGLELARIKGLAKSVAEISHASSQTGRDNPLNKLQLQLL